MKRWNKCLKRVLAVALAGAMVISVPELSAIAAANMEASSEVVETENVETTKNQQSSISEETIVYEEIVDLGTIETTGYAMSLFGTESSIVPLKSGNYEKWIDRIDVPEYAIELYNTFVEGSDNDGNADVLMNGTEKIEVTTLELSEDPQTSPEFAKVKAIIRAVYDAFDRDHPEVFWLSGQSMVSYSYSQSNGVYHVTVYFLLKSGSYDVRAEEYTDSSVLETAISQRDTAVANILSGTTSTDTVELIEYFNDWLIQNNEYNTCVSNNITDGVSRDCWEAISALKGSTGVNGPVCEGYARAFKILCDKVNIPCVLVDGYGNGGAHMWNNVKVDGSWYATDITWNDPVGGNSGAVSGFERKDWLLLGSTEFNQTHTVENIASNGGVPFTNGPVLSTEEYVAPPESAIQFVTLSQSTVAYSAGGVGVEVTYGSWVTDTSVTEYQWYKKTETDTAEPVEGATTFELPQNVSVGTYYCEVTYGTESKNSPEVTVEKAELEACFNGNVYEKVYDGTTTINASEEELSLSYLCNTVAVDDITATVKYEFADPNVKWDEGFPTSQTIRATITLTGDSAQNYKLENNIIENDYMGMILPIDLTDKEVEITLENDGKLIYNGENQTMNVVRVEADGQEIATNAYIVEYNKEEFVGDYELVITFLNGNYSGTVTKEFSIEYLPFDLKNLTYNGSSDLKEWYNDNVVIQAEGYTILQDDGTYQETYTIENEGIYDGMPLQFKNANGYITDMIELPSVKIDKGMPTAQISIQTNTWYELLNEITFGIFFKETQEVTIHADDTFSDVLECYYYIDKSGSTTVKTVEELDALTFTKGNTFNIENDDKYVIYAYATDEAGNKSSYVCSNGMVMDTTVPEISEIIEPNVANETLTDTSAIIHFTGSEIGTCSYEVFDNMEQLIESSEEVLVDKHNTIVLTDLIANTTYEVRLTITDEAGNVSEVKKISFTTQKILPQFSSIPEITGTYGQKLSEMITALPTRSSNGIEGTWSVSKTDVIPNAGDTTEYAVTFTPNDQQSYGICTITVFPNVSKKDITVTINNATKVFGKENPIFDVTVSEDALVGEDKTDDLNITLSTTATQTSEVGTYAITGTANAKNYNVTFTNGTLTITKAEAESIGAIEKIYIYTLGSEGNSESVNIKDLLPTDSGTTSYVLATTGKILSNAEVDKNGVLTYKVEAGDVNETASITITAQSKNYKDITVVVNVTLTEKTPIALKEGSKVEIADGETLTYGDKLSELSFKEAVFVTKDGTVVEGTLAWVNPNEVFVAAGENNAEWVFTPNDSEKYTSVSDTITITVAKKEAPSIDAISKKYIYTLGSNGTEVSVDITEKLPTDRGTTTYDVTFSEDILSDVAVNENGVVTYKVNAGKLNASASITVNATSNNYEPISIVINIGLTDKTPVELKEGEVVTVVDGKTVTYGETLNGLSLNEAVFVTEEGTVVEGTLIWANSNEIFQAGTNDATWKFIPTESNRYAETTGTVKVTVTKATPNADKLPSAESVVYHPNGTLADVTLGNANANWVVGDTKKEVEGTWSWKNAETVLTIGKSSHTAVFTPTDKTNYNSVEKTVEVIVTKATPIVKTLPTASTITYGDTLTDSTLTNGKVVYEKGSDIVIEGTFAWENATIAPKVSDSNQITYKVIFIPKATDLYETITTEVTVTVEKKEITANISNASKTFGTTNPPFDFTVSEELFVGNDSKTDLNITLSTTATKTSEVGTYTITGSANAENYKVIFTNGTLTITQAKAPIVEAINKTYVYTVGSENEIVSVDIAKQLPTDKGTTTYKCKFEGELLSNAEVDKNGVVTYKVEAGELTDSANITITAESKNYEPITVVINITLTDKIPVEVKDGQTVSVVEGQTLTYGETLSALSLTETVFVTKDGKEVAGTLAWANPNEIFNAGTQSAKWTFTPTNGKYVGTEGNLSITVAKATPNVTIPTTEAITYNPSVTLNNITLNGTNGAWIVGGTETEVKGTWRWKDSAIVPTVKNNGYTAIFTPADTNNYETVSKTVEVTVTKATPIVATLPSASSIIYGDTLKNADLSGGAVAYAEGSDIVIEGTFAWKDTSIAPTATDSNVTPYEVVFTPNDGENYKSVSCKVTLVVEKQEWPSNTPEGEVEVDYDIVNVSDIELPEGWEWSEEANAITLKPGEEVIVTAEYVADDKENFENTQVEIKVTRLAEAPHIENNKAIMGWEAIGEEIKSSPNAEVRVDMNGFTELDTNILKQLKETPNTTLVLVFDNGLTWTTKGSDVEAKEFDKYIDMGVELFEKDDEDRPNIPQNLINSVAKSGKYKLLSLKHDGNFGFKAVLTLKLGKEFAGNIVTIYYYDEESEELTNSVSVEADAEGGVTFAFTHASDYVITMEEIVEEPSNPENPSKPEDPSTPENPSNPEKPSTPQKPSTPEQKPDEDKTSPNTGYYDMILYFAGLFVMISAMKVVFVKKVKK